MKSIALLFILAGTLAVKADDATTNAAPTGDISVGIPGAAVGTDTSAAPGDGFQAKRYESLWTKSPFAVETPDAVEDSPDYSLVGVAQLDGISYASLVEKQNQQHFLISSDKPSNGLTLTSITRGHDSTDTTAALVKDGQPITLKLEAAPMVAPQPMPGVPTIAMPGGPGMSPNIPMPGTPQPGGGMPTRPLIRIHRPAIHLPPRTTADPGAPVPAPAAQTAPPPPAPSR